MIEAGRNDWNWCDMSIGSETMGAGRSLLLLPALSSISTRREMQPLMGRLATRYRVTATDWPGFGEAARPRFDWTPKILSAFLEDMLADRVAEVDVVIAAGHAATYALAYAAAYPGRLSKLVLIAPTWRGPLPTMTDGQRPWFTYLHGAFDAPVLGALLYRLNMCRPMLRMMAREHVYQNARWLDRRRLLEKERVTAAPGARHASVRFVTGALDPVASRAAFLDLAKRANLPILMVYGGGTPKRSRAEMEALEQQPGVTTVRLPQGRLAVHEEFPAPVADEIARFLETV